MANPQLKSLIPPLGGIHRGVAVQAQPPFTTPDAENFFPLDSLLQRERGGSRPGSMRLYKTSGSQAVRLIHSVTVKKPNATFAYKSDSFNYGAFPSSRWTSSITGLTSTSPTISAGKVIGNKGDATEQKALLHAAISDMKTSATSDTYVLGIYVLPYVDAHHGVYSIYFRMASSPDIASSLEARMTITGAGTVSIALYKDAAVSPLVTWTPTADAVAQEGWLEVQWTKGSTNDLVECFWRGSSVGSTSTLTGNKNKFTITVTSPSVTYAFGPGGASDYFATTNGSGLISLLDTPTGYSVVAGGLGFDFATYEKNTAGEESPQYDETGGANAGKGTLVIDVAGTSTVVGTSTNNRFGFGLKATTTSGRVQVGRFMAQYNKTAAYELLRPITVVVQNGQILRDKNWFFRFEALASDLRLAADRTLQAVERGQKLYIADNSEPLAAGTDGVITSGTSFDSATYTDWTTILSNSVGTDTYFGNFVVHVTSPTGSAGIYPITALASGSLTIARAINGTSLTFRIERGPKIFDPVADTLTAWASDTYSTGTIEVVDGVVTLSGTGAEAPDWTEGAFMYYSGAWYAVDTLDTDTQWTLVDTTVTIGGGASYALIRGTVPCGCKSIAKTGDRILLSADALDPNEYYGSGLGQPGDWLFNQTGAGAAFKGGNPNAGRVGDVVISMMEYSQDLVLFGCRNSLFILSGTPPAGGSVDAVSHRTSLFSLTSWCSGPGGETYWIGHDSMYMATPQCLACEPEPVSRDKLPLELQNLNPELVTVAMEYDQNHRGIWITLTPIDATDGVVHYFYRPDTKAFFPILFASTDGNPTFLRWVSMPDSEDSCVLMGGSAGSIRRFSWTAHNDADAAQAFNVAIGPILLGMDSYGYGSAMEVRVKLGEDSAPATLKIYQAKTAQGAVDALTTQTPQQFALPTGDSYSIYPRVRGGAVMFEIVGTTAGRHVSLESIRVVLDTAGTRRV